MGDGVSKGAEQSKVIIENQREAKGRIQDQKREGHRRCTTYTPSRGTVLVVQRWHFQVFAVSERDAA